MADENPTPDKQEVPEGIDPVLADLVREDRFDVADVLAIQERYQKAKAELLQKYPEVAEELERSFQTPQIGPHHKEGKTLESHVALILHVIEKLDNDEVDADIQDPALRALLVDTIKKHKEEFEEYVFFHDVAKPDCITVTPAEGNEKMEITWDQWLEIQAKGEPYSVEVPEYRLEVKDITYYRGTGSKKPVKAESLDFDITTDRDVRMDDGIVINRKDKTVNGGKGLLVTWPEWQAIKAQGQPYTYVRPTKGVPIETTGYYHQSKGLEDGSHGNVGAKLLEGKLGEGKPSPLILMAMRMHETAFQQFAGDNMSAERYEANYASFPEEDLAVILTASYVDFAGSLKEKGGESTFTPLLNVVTARNNYRLIQRYLDSCPDELRAVMFPEKSLNKIRNANKVLTQKDLEGARTKLKTYTEDEVRDALAQAKGKTDADVITPDEANQVVAILATGDPVNLNDAGRVLGRKLGFTMRHLINIGTDTFVLKPE